MGFEEEGQNHGGKIMGNGCEKRRKPKKDPQRSNALEVLKGEAA